MKSINYHTICDFRVKNREALDDLFTEILGILSAEGLITLERIMHDGTKIKANAGSDSYRREDRIKAHLKLAEEHIKEMGDPEKTEELSARVRAAKKRAAIANRAKLELAVKELEGIQGKKKTEKDKKAVRVSKSDPESRIIKHGNGVYAPSYNVQITTDEKNAMIVGVGVSQSASDIEELVPALETVENNIGKPDQIVADGGFTSRKNIIEMEERNVDFIGSFPEHTARTIAHYKKKGISPEFYADKFKYNEENNRCICPKGKILAYDGKETRPGCINYKYLAKVQDCNSCLYKKKCCPGSKKKGRSILRNEEDIRVINYKKKMETDEAKKIYKKRGPIAEFPNAWIKEKFRLRQFRLNGKKKVSMEVTWAALTYNIQQWIRIVWRPRIQNVMLTA